MLLLLSRLHVLQADHMSPQDRAATIAADMARADMLQLQRLKTDLLGLKALRP